MVGAVVVLTGACRAWTPAQAVGRELELTGLGRSVEHDAISRSLSGTAAEFWRRRGCMYRSIAFRLAPLITDGLLARLRRMKDTASALWC